MSIDRSHDIPHSGPWTEPAIRLASSLAQVAPALVFSCLVVVLLLNMELFHRFPQNWVLEAPSFLLLTNALVSTVVVTVAVMALKGYVSDGRPNLIFLGAGMLTFAGSNFIAGWFGSQGAANINLTIHNTGMFLSSAFHLAGCFGLMVRKSSQDSAAKNPKTRALAACASILVLLAGLSFMAAGGLTPPFNTPGSGPTSLRAAVLLAAAACFGISAIILLHFHREKSNLFRSCYGWGLGLLAISMIVLVTSKQANNPLSWFGRSLQVLSALYFVAAMGAALRMGKASSRSLSYVMADCFRPTEALYEDLVEAAGDAIILVGGRGEILVWSTAAVRTFGYTREEATQFDAPDLFNPEDSVRLLRNIESAVAQEKPGMAKSMEMEGRKKGGEAFPAEVSCSSRLLEGRCVSTLIVRDITERKKTGDAVHQSEERFRLAVKATKDAIYDVNLSTGTLYCNDVFYAAFGLRAEKGEDPWRWWIDRIHPEDREGAAGSFFRALDGDDVSWSGEYRFLRFDGQWADIADRAYIARGASGKARRVIGAMLDLTDRKQMEDQLRRSRDELEVRVRERTEALARANEELRQIPPKLIAVQEEERKRLASELHDSIGQTLAAVKFGIELALNFRSSGDRDAVFDYLEQFIPMLQRSIGETRNIYMGLHPSMLDNVGLLAALEWLRRECMRFYPERHIELQADIAEQEIPEGIKLGIFRIVQEALNNIAKHSNAEWVDISLSMGGNGIELVISDDGVGMDQDRLSQAGISGGLGLTSMKDRAELLGGTFSIDSVPGSGTVIRACWRKDARDGPGKEGLTI